MKRALLIFGSCVLVFAIVLISVLKVLNPRMSVNVNPGCHARIAELVCVVSPPKVEKDRYRIDRTCEKGVDTSVFIRQLNSAYDAYPEFIQKQFCALSKIYLETEFFGNAWSDTGVIAINKKLSDANLDEAQALTEFDQLTFGSNLSSLVVKVDPSQNAVTHTLLHELGHTFDYQYDFQTKGWKKLGSESFPLQKRICLNNCRGKTIPVNQVPELYKELNDSGFVSQLAAVSPMEDFAETFSFVVERESMNRKRTMVIDGVESDPLSGPAISKKIGYMRWILTWLSHGAKGELE